MDEWLADLLDAPWARSPDAVPGPNPLLLVLRSFQATGWAVEFLINDGDRQVELKGFLSP